VTIYSVRTTRYRVRRPIPDLARRIARSPFADDVKAAYRSGVTIIGGIAIAYGALLVLRGAAYAAQLVGVTR
jgi:hypothetical protein